MSLISIVHRVHAGALTDVYGDPTTPIETVEVIPEAFDAPTSTGDIDRIGPDGTADRRDVFLPLDVVVGRHDSIRIDGEEFTIDGVPAAWEGLSGWRAGQVVHVYRILG